MGAPYNQLQQLTGLAPTRAIGVGHLKNYFADIAKPNLALNWNTQIKQIDFDRFSQRVAFQSGTFFPALREEFGVKSFTSGDQRAEPMDFPRYAMTFTGGPVLAPRDVPRLGVLHSGNHYAIATEIGYINLHNIRGHLKPFWHEEGFLKQVFSGEVIKYIEDPVSASYVFFEGKIYPTHVAKEQAFIEEGDGPVNVTYWFHEGTIQGG